MTLDEVLDVAERGRRAGATECLFTLGDRPEARYPAARDELRAMGHASTVDYLAHCAGEVLRRVGLLPHCNAGVLTREELAKLRKVSVSQGLMLESATDRLVDQPDAAHEGCESKRPAARLRTTTLAGELRVPFTSGVLIGIGETREERIDALFAIRDADRACAADRGAATGHVHEIIVQNFRAKSDTRMRDHPEPTLEELLWTAATARLIFGPHAVVQVPPNLTPEPDDARVRRDDGEDGDFGDFGGRRDGADCSARASRIGGISGRRHPRPRLSRSAVAAPRRTGGGDSRGGVLARAPDWARSPSYVVGGALDEWVDAGGGATRQSRRGRRRLAARVGMVPDARGGGERGRGGDEDENRGRARIDRGGVRRLETGPRGRLGRSSTLAARSSSASEKCDRLWTGADLAPRGDVGVAASPEIEAAIARLASRGAAMAAVAERGEPISEDSSSAAEELALDRAAVETLVRARGADFDRVCAAADARASRTVRRRGDVRGEPQHQLHERVYPLVRAFCAFSKGPPGRELELRGPTYLLDDDEVSRRAAEAGTAARRRCACRAGSTRVSRARITSDCYARRGRRAEDSRARLLALEVTHGARTTGASVPAFIARLRDEGLGSLPGTAAEVLDDAVRAELCPDKISAKEWLDVVSSAHDAGVPTTSTMMFGHVDADGPPAWAAHLLALRDAHAASTRRRRRRERESAVATTGFSEFVPLPFGALRGARVSRGAISARPDASRVPARAVARLVLGPAGANCRRRG